MMLALPKELYQAVQEAGAQPVRLVHPETHVEYVVLPAARFDRGDADADSRGARRVARRNGAARWMG